MNIQDFLVQGEGHEEDKRQAWELFQQAFARQMKGELEEAVNLYKQSIATHPTAEAYTFLGWTYSFMGRLDDAIEECHKAIAQDPDFGNPYNDIGAYLIENYGYGHANSKSFAAVPQETLVSLGISEPEKVMQESVFLEGEQPPYDELYIKIYEEVQAGL